VRKVSKKNIESIHIRNERLREKTHTIPKLVRNLSLTIKAHDSSYEPDNRSNAYKMLHL
jgi:hypothetical protein